MLKKLLKSIGHFFQINWTFVLVILWLIPVTLGALVVFRVFNFWFYTTPDRTALDSFIPSAWFAITLCMIVLTINFALILLASFWRVIAKIFVFGIEPLILAGALFTIYDIAAHPLNSDNSMGMLGQALLLGGIIYPLLAALALRAPFMFLLLWPKNCTKTRILVLVFSCVLMLGLTANYLAIARIVTADALTTAQGFGFQIYKPTYLPEQMTGYFEGAKGGVYYYGWDYNNSGKTEYHFFDIKVEEQKTDGTEYVPPGRYKKEDIMLNGQPAKLYIDTIEPDYRHVVIVWKNNNTVMKLEVSGGLNDLPDLSGFMRYEAIKIAESMQPLKEPR